VGLPNELVLCDEVMQPFEARSEYYSMRVKFARIVALASNVVSLLLLPSTPSIPPMLLQNFLELIFVIVHW